MNEEYFKPFRENIIGNNDTIVTPFGEKKLLYADWIASGRMYKPIEENMMNNVYPFCANTHTETTYTGTLMTNAYDYAKNYIKKAVNARDEDILIFSGTGMTDCINKLQRILGLRIPEKASNFFTKMTLFEENERPVVFITHIEHHSNQTSWLETIADVVIVPPNEKGEVCVKNFEIEIEKFKDRKLKIASISACSNVTGIYTPYHQIAEIIHHYHGYCFVDFACSAPYVAIDMHPALKSQQLDAIFISPHKFLGGPGTPGIMILNPSLYDNTIPDRTGGGTVRFTNPWHFHEYFDNAELKEDGGTPGFLQGIRAALSFKLKNEMGTENIQKREHDLVQKALSYLTKIPGIHVFASHLHDRLGCISFYHTQIHFNLFVKILNDMYGIQVRGGCACAGTYGHYLLSIDELASQNIIKELRSGNLSCRPGWVRLSLHPTLSNDELQYILDAIQFVAKNYSTLSLDYNYIAKKNMYEHKNQDNNIKTTYLQKLFHA